MDPFQLCKIKISHPSFFTIIATHDLWILTCFLFMQTMARYFLTLAQLLVLFSPWQKVKPLGHHLHTYRIFPIASERHRTKYLIILQAVENRRICVLFVDLAHKLFGNEMMLLLKKFCNSLHVLLVLVNPRLANGASLMELGQKIHVLQPPLTFSKHA